jgi:hypothetical protein
LSIPDLKSEMLPDEELKLPPLPSHHQAAIWDFPGEQGAVDRDRRDAKAKSGLFL